ncbi:glycosyltransferase [Streptomyces sp. NRRL B-3648]|uniref:glycosyltransferase n=1 Tax=Streptomyces sp. NRRL B-3648 TaxID=1519493 RepID=UPI0006B02CEA|nr:glycosyltransferase [Streptomyces sp. NRRL B-3648]KOX11399.1 hypothetical protein ADL04_00120 [Streptomyces sp. NRRL B-3648]
MKILFEPLGGALGIGAITRCLAMAQAAVMRGHRVAFLAPDGYPLVDELALGPRFPAPAPVRPPELVGTGEADGFTEAVLIRGMAQPDYAERAIAAELDAYRTFAPDIVVTEMQPTVPIAAHLTGIPFACTISSPNLSLFTATPRSPGRLEEVEATYTSLCERHGVPPAPLEELLHHRAALNIAPTAEVLEPALGAVPRTRFVGPVLLPSLELAPAPAYPAGSTRVLVYLSFGAVKLAEFLPVVGKAFPGPEFSVVVAAREPSVAGRTVPFRQDNIVVAPTPGMTRLLSDTDLLITRGGQNALMAALLAGVPVIGTPGRSPEPIYNLGTLEAHGAARTLLDEPTADDLVQAAQALLDGKAARRAARLGDLLRRHGGATEAVQALEETVLHRTPAPAP